MGRAGPDALDSPEAWFKSTNAPHDLWGVFPRIAWDVFEKKTPEWKITLRYFQNIVNDVRDLNSAVGEEKHYKAGMHKDPEGFMGFDWIDAVRGKGSPSTRQKFLVPSPLNFSPLAR